MEKTDLRTVTLSPLHSDEKEYTLVETLFFVTGINEVFEFLELCVIVEIALVGTPLLSCSHPCYST